MIVFLFPSVLFPLAGAGGSTAWPRPPLPPEKTIEGLKHPNVNEPEPRDQRDQTRKKGVRIRRSSDSKTCACVAISSTSVLIRNRSNLECSTTETGFLCSVITVNTLKSDLHVYVESTIDPVKVDAQPELCPQATPPNSATALFLPITHCWVLVQRSRLRLHP